VPKGALAVLHKGAMAYANGEDVHKAVKDAGGIGVAQAARTTLKSIFGGVPMVGNALTSAIDSVSFMTTFSAAELDQLHVMIVNYAAVHKISLK
jgi:hypothetical protein